GKTRLHKGERLLFTARERAGECLRSLRYLLFHHRCCRRVLADIDLPSGQARSQPCVLSLFSNRERKLVFVDRNLNTFFLSIKSQVLHLHWLKRFQEVFLWVGLPSNDSELCFIELD